MNRQGPSLRVATLPRDGGLAECPADEAADAGVGAGPCAGAGAGACAGVGEDTGARVEAGAGAGVDVGVGTGAGAGAGLEGVLESGAVVPFGTTAADAGADCRVAGGLVEPEDVGRVALLAEEAGAGCAAWAVWATGALDGGDNERTAVVPPDEGEAA